MAGHPHGGMAAKMRRLQQEYQQKADALKVALEIVNGHDLKKKQDTHEQLFEAVKLDAARRKHRIGRPIKAAVKLKPPKKTHAKQKSAASRETNRQRQQKHAIKFLSRFDTEIPRPGGQGVSIYLQHGYLRKQGDGVVRTDKPYPAPE